MQGENEKEWTAIQEAMVGWRRDLHRMPELMNEVPNTSAYVQRVLKGLGIPFQTLMEGNAVVGHIPGKKKGAGKVLALRADMDGLKVKEETGLPFASQNGCMHACGHDGHMAMLLGAASYLQAHREAFSGEVRLLFQPGEEYPGGAKPMIREGCLENPRVDVVFGMHEGQISPDLPPGYLGFRKGAIMAAMDRLLIRVKGKGGHAANPHKSVDPIPLASEMVLALQTLMSRERNPVEPAILSITRFTAGFNQNVIPDTAELEGTVRTVNPKTRVWLRDRIRELCRDLARSRGAEVEIEHLFKYPALLNDPDFTELAKRAAATIYPEDKIMDLPAPNMGSEDFAFYTEEVPGTFAFMSNPKPADGRFTGHHSSHFDVDEGMFSTGARLFVQVALDFLQ